MVGMAMKCVLVLKKCFIAADIERSFHTAGYGPGVPLLCKTLMGRTGLFIEEQSSKLKDIMLDALEVILSSQNMFTKRNLCKRALLKSLSMQKFTDNMSSHDKSVRCTLFPPLLESGLQPGDQETTIIVSA